MNKYEVLGVVGEGAYGVVLRCRNKESGEVVAIKKFKESDDDEVLRKTTLREVKILRMLKHNNIVSLTEAFRRKAKLYLVFEYVDKNLLEVLEEQPQGLDPDVVRLYIHQLVRAINWCHSNDVIHRDIKPENLLINVRTKTLKLCDFGFARVLSPSAQELTDYVATRWYRAPELLLGSTSYGFGVDMWAIGCIMGEISDGQPIFPGESEVDQLYIVQKVVGPLIPEHVEIFMANPRFSGLKFPDMTKPETLQKKYMGKLSKRALSFLNTLLSMDPADRPSSSLCQQNAYFEGLDIVDSHPAPHQHSPVKQPSADFKSSSGERPLQQHVESNSSSSGGGVMPKIALREDSSQGQGSPSAIPSIIPLISQHEHSSPKAAMGKTAPFGNLQGGSGMVYESTSNEENYHNHHQLQQQQLAPKAHPKPRSQQDPQPDVPGGFAEHKLSWGDAGGNTVDHGPVLPIDSDLSSVNQPDHADLSRGKGGKPKRNAGSKAGDLDREAERERDRQREKEIRAFRDFSTKLPIKQSRRQKAASFDKDPQDRAAFAPPALLAPLDSGAPIRGPGQGYNLQLDERSFHGNRRNNNSSSINPSSNNSVMPSRMPPIDQQLGGGGGVPRRQQQQYGLHRGGVPGPQISNLQRGLGGFDSMDFAAEMQSLGQPAHRSMQGSGLVFNNSNASVAGIGHTGWQHDMHQQHGGGAPVGHKYMHGGHQQHYTGYGLADHLDSHAMGDSFMPGQGYGSGPNNGPGGGLGASGGLGIGNIRNRGGAMQIAGSASIGRGGMYPPSEQHMGGTYSSSSNVNLMLPQIHAGLGPPSYKPYEGGGGGPVYGGGGGMYGDSSYGRGHHGGGEGGGGLQQSPYAYGDQQGGAKRNSNNVRVPLAGATKGYR